MKIKTFTTAVFFCVFVLTQVVLALQLKIHAADLPKPFSENEVPQEYYVLITSPETKKTRLQQIEIEQREREIEYLKQFEEVDYRFFNGDAEAYNGIPKDTP